MSMSSTTAGQQGLEAVRNKKWEEAIPLLDKGLSASNSPLWLLARSEAHCQLKHYDQALVDAERALLAAADRGNRQLMSDAEYRRSIVYQRLGRLADSDCCARWSISLMQGFKASEDDGVTKDIDEAGNYTATYDKMVTQIAQQKTYAGKKREHHQAIYDNKVRAMREQDEPFLKPKRDKATENGMERRKSWRCLVLRALEKLPENDPGRKVTVTKFPSKPATQTLPDTAGGDSEDSDIDVSESKDSDESKKEARRKLEALCKEAAFREAAAERKQEQAIEVAPQQVHSNQELQATRVAYYQTNDKFSISFFCKNIDKNAFQVGFFERQVRMGPLPPRKSVPSPLEVNTPESVSTLLLKEKIVPSSGTFTVTPSKVEIVMQKATPGEKWSWWGWEVIGFVEPGTEHIVCRHLNGYPQDDIIKRLLHEGSKSEPIGPPPYPTSSKRAVKDWEKIVLDEDAEADEGDINGFFKKLYAGASPEQQRAMMKSFTESNGTALSMNWDDVQKGKVGMSPPDGVEAKKWDA
ncbi:SGS domain-containing protein [Echria macrotheca]|uniref:SGS domain-containing protein n=1 Tax=Echria macrotheca TaxID=438768 RepID=A0AAJ0FDF9_9PEZI|nr:SGS domain-containing protein [Echria macrotheca]